MKAIAESKIGAKISCKVSLTFQHGKSEYEISRKSVAIKDNLELKNTSKIPPRVIIRDEQSGASKEGIGNPEEMIQRILPKGLAAYFFFDGENLQHMTEKSKKSDIKEAIKIVMGTSLFERASKDLLGQVHRKFIKDQKYFGSNETKEIVEKLENLKNENSKLKEDLSITEKGN